MKSKSEPRKRNSSKKHEAILEGAIKSFVEQGYDKTSMDYIAEVSGASKRTVYNHFTSKDNLFQAVIEKFLTEQHTLKEITYDSTQTLEAQLTAFAQAELYLIDSPARRGLSRVLTSVFIRDIDYAKATRGKYGSPHQPLINWLVAASADRRLDIDNPQLAARIFYSMIEGALTWPALFKHDLDTADTQELLAEMVFTFLCRYRKPT